MSNTSVTTSNNKVKIVGQDNTTVLDVVVDGGVNVLPVTGDVTTAPVPISDTVFDTLKNGGSSDMRVDGTTPVDFKYEDDPTDDIYITAIKYAGIANGLRLDKFLSVAELTNGMELSITSDGGTFTFPVMRTTADIKHIWTFNGNCWVLEFLQGFDGAMAVMKFDQPIVLKANSNDEITVKIQDDLTAQTLKQMQVYVAGYKL